MLLRFVSVPSLCLSALFRFRVLCVIPLGLKIALPLLRSAPQSVSPRKLLTPSSNLDAPPWRPSFIVTNPRPLYVLIPPALRSRVTYFALTSLTALAQGPPPAFRILPSKFLGHASKLFHSSCSFAFGFRHPCLPLFSRSSCVENSRRLSLYIHTSLLLCHCLCKYSPSLS